MGRAPIRGMKKKPLEMRLQSQHPAVLKRRLKFLELSHRSQVRTQKSLYRTLAK